MLECAQRIRAKTVYISVPPLVDISLSFLLGARGKTRNRMEIWNALIASVQSVLGSENLPLIKTPEEGIDFLISQLHSTPYVARDKKTGRTRFDVGFRAAWDYESYQWCFSLIKEVNAALRSVFDSTMFHCRGYFSINPFIDTPDVQRSRKDHIKIWQLIESAVVQLYPDLE